MPEKTLLAYADHGQFAQVMAWGGGDAETMLTRFAQAGIDVEALALRLQHEGEQSFVNSWQELMQRIAEKSSALVGSREQEHSV